MIEVTPTPFTGLYIIECPRFADERGFFTEAFHAGHWQERGLPHAFVQDNQSRSRRNVLRGLHFQKAPYAQTKLVRVLHGAILSVVVDLRKGQHTYGQYFSIELSESNGKQLLIPKGFANGFIARSEQADIVYKCDAHYRPESECGLAFDDPQLGINWGVSHKDVILSEKDRAHPRLSELDVNFQN